MLRARARRKLANTNMADPTSHTSPRWRLWIVLLLLATAACLYAPDWDGGLAAHPDERFLLSVAQSTPLWGDPNILHPNFPYGHLPLYVAGLLARVAPHANLTYTARLFCALLGVLLVATAGAWGKRLAGEWGGLLAAATFACAPFPIQLAHFYTVDPFAALLSSLALLLALRRRYFLAGLFAGWTLASKASMIWLGGGLLAALWLTTQAVPVAGRWWMPTLLWRREARPRLRPALQLAVGSLLGFAEVSPWALLAPARNWAGALIQARMVAGQLDYPYTRQYAGTLPYLYPLAQLALWGLGLTATLAALLGLALALRGWRTRSPALRVAWLWTVGYFIVTAGMYVKFPRYLLPIYPLLAAWGAFAVREFSILDFRFWPPQFTIRHSPFAIRLFAIGFLLLPTLALGVGQLSLYTQPHPWIAASHWIYESAPPGSLIAVEHWDHPLPVYLPGKSPSIYQQQTMLVFAPDTAEKATELGEVFMQADMLVFASRRGYGALIRLPERYAETLDWYTRVFAAPDRKVRVFARCARLGPLALSDDPFSDAGLPAPVNLAERCGTRWALRLPRLDESFRVYDAPLTIVFYRGSE